MVKWLRRKTRRSEDIQSEFVDDKPKGFPSNDMSTQTESRPATEPPPYSQEPNSTSLPEYDLLFSRTQAVRTCVRAAVSAAGATGGQAAARAVATVIRQVSLSVADVPKAEKPTTASIMNTAVIKFAAKDVQSGRRIISSIIFDQALDSAPAASVPMLTNGLPTVLSNIDRALSLVVPWQRTYVAATIADAVVKVTGKVATASLYGGKWIAGVYSDLADDTAKNIPEHNDITDYSGHRRELPGPDRMASSSAGNSSDIHSHSNSSVRSGHHLQLLEADQTTNSSTDKYGKCGSCEDVRRATEMQAVIYALWKHASEFRDIPAESALAAVAAGAGLPRADSAMPTQIECTCAKSFQICEASLKVSRIRAALLAVKSYAEMRDHTKAAEALSVAERQIMHTYAL
ncbi:hypothetical protein VTH82DRAFT_4570 [Thermothelomyces myriococcoides]